MAFLGTNAKIGEVKTSIVLTSHNLFDFHQK